MSKFAFRGRYRTAVRNRLELTITPPTQYATAYIGDRPVATVRRRHSFDPRSAPTWTIYGTDGITVQHGQVYGAPSVMHLKRIIARRLAKLEIK